MQNSNSGNLLNNIDLTKKDGKETMIKIEKVDKNVRGAFKYYRRHVENLKCVEAGTPNCYLIGDSPFGDSSIVITQKRRWYCNSIEQGGDEVEFLQVQHPLLTEKGANRASIEETVKTPDFDDLVILDEENIRQHLQSFHEELQLCEVIDDARKAVLYKVY